MKPILWARVQWNRLLRALPTEKNRRALRAFYLEAGETGHYATWAQRPVIASRVIVSPLSEKLTLQLREGFGTATNDPAPATRFELSITNTGKTRALVQVAVSARFPDSNRVALLALTRVPPL